MDPLDISHGSAMDLSEMGLGGKVSGPASATPGAVALFDGPTGKRIKNSTPAAVRSLLGAQSRLLLTVGSEDADYITDGVDDNVQIQAALDELSAAGGGRLFIKKGIYNLAAALDPDFSGLVIEGEDAQNTILRMGDDLNVSVFAFSNEGLSNIFLRDLTIDGNGANQTSGGGGLTVSRIDDLVLENIILKTSYNFNILISSGTGAALTGTMTFTNGDDTVAGSGTLFTSELTEGMIIKTPAGQFVRVVAIVSDTSLQLDRQFEYTTETAVAATKYTGNRRVTMKNVRAEGSLNTDNIGLGLLVDGYFQNCDSRDSGGGYGFGPDHCWDTVFDNCNGIGNDNDGLGMETCSGCRVIGGNYNNSVSGNGIRLLSGSYRNTIIAPHCKGNVNGINISNNSASFGTPDGNTIIGGDYALNSGHGIRIGGASKTHIVAPRCYNNVTSGIVVVTENSVVPDSTFIADPVCYDSQDTKTQARGILISSSTNTVIKNPHSRTSDHVTAGITDSGTATVIITTDAGVTTITSSTGDVLRINGIGTNNALLRFQDEGVNRGEIFVANGSANLSIRSSGGDVLIGGGGSTTGGVVVDEDNSVVIGAAAVNAAAKFQIDSVTKGFLPPRMTTTQRDAISSPPAGLMIYNTTTNKLNLFTTAWEVITSV